MKYTNEGLVEYAVGEQLTEGTDTLVVVEDVHIGCFECYFYSKSPSCINLACESFRRSDGRGVHFEEVKEGV